MVKKKEKATEKPVNKTPELAAAKTALENYLKENHLDPTKDWTKDKTHGKQVTKLVKKLNQERDKAAAKYPESDPKQMKRLKKKAETIANGIEKKAKKENGTSESKAAKGDKPARKVPSKYNYPLIDGREMTSAEKKKYRAEQRKLATKPAGKPATETVEKSSKKAKKDKVSSKKEETPKVAKKAKAKKAVKEED